MDWHDVDSSNIRRIAHDGAALHVEFHSGAIYAYDGADEHHLHEMKSAASAGNYFHQNIRQQHAGRRV